MSTTTRTFHFHDFPAEGIANAVPSTYASTHALLRSSQVPSMRSVTPASRSGVPMKSPSPTLSHIPTRSPPFMLSYSNMFEEAYRFDN